MSLKILMAGLSLCLSFHTLLATTDDIITGTVCDESGQYMEFVNVKLMSLKDSALIRGVVTDSVGRFTLMQSIEPTFLNISAMGYEEMTIDNPQGTLGIVKLIPSAFNLKEVIISGHRPSVTLKSDGIQVAIAGTYLAHTGTALEVLYRMPFVNKSETGLEVFGRGAPLIYINGRKVRNQSELEQLASSDIKSVDVLTSPGSRYDSSVNAVIRITTLSPAGQGFSFSDRTTLGYKHKVYLFEQANFNYRKNGLDIFAMINYENYRERIRYANNTSLYMDKGIVGQSATGNEYSKYPVYQGKIGVNYNSENQYLGFYYDYSYRPSKVLNNSVTTRLLNDVLEDELSSSVTSSGDKRQHSLNAYYSGTFGDWKLEANVDALWQSNSKTNLVDETSSVHHSREFTANNDVENNLIAANILASHPIDKWNLNFGAELTNIRRCDRYSANVDFISDNDTKINELSSALFAEASRTYGKVSLRLGLRWEFTDARYYLFGLKMGEQSRKYNNLAPNISISAPIGNVSARLSYTRKTSRPAFDQLSSAIRYLDRYSYESGNPNLKPIYRDYVSLTGSWRDIILEMSMCSTDNYFMWQTTPYEAVPDATLLKMENMPRFYTFEAIANYSPCFFEIWRPSLMAGILAQNFTVIHNGMEIKQDHPLFIFRFNNSIHLPWNVWLNIDFSGRTSGNSDNMYIKSQWRCDIGLYKSFANDKWSVKLQVDDLFNTSGLEFVLYDAITWSDIRKIYDTRDISLTVRCNFNIAASRYQGRDVAPSDKDRL